MQLCCGHWKMHSNELVNKEVAKVQKAHVWQTRTFHFLHIVLWFCEEIMLESCRKRAHFHSRLFLCISVLLSKRGTKTEKYWDIFKTMMGLVLQRLHLTDSFSALSNTNLTTTSLSLPHALNILLFRMLFASDFDAKDLKWNCSVEKARKEVFQLVSFIILCHLKNNWYYTPLLPGLCSHVRL